MMSRIMQRSTLMMCRGAMKQTLFASHIHHHRPVSLPASNSLATLFYSTTHSAQNQNSSAAAAPTTTDPIPANPTTNHTNTTTNTSSEQSQQQQQQQQEAEKVISIEELQRAAQKAQQEAKTRKEMENLLKTVIYRGARSIALFVLAFSAFFYVVKQKGSESRIVRYLEALRRTRGDSESENDGSESDNEEEQQWSEQERVLKRQALEKTEQLKREMKDATWYMSDDSDDDDDSGDKKKKSGSSSRIGDNIDTRAAKEQREALIASNGKK